MKKIIFTLFMLYIFIVPVYAEDYITEDNSFTYNGTINAIQEVMKAYYLRGPNLQYNYARANYGTINPEDATSQDLKHLVCASYTYSTYVEAFGVNGSTEGFPRYNYEITNQAREYYETGKNLDGHYLRYYATKNNATEYIYGSNNLVTNFANNVEPGDLFTYTGHAMIAYKVVERTTSDGTKYKDVLMLNSGNGYRIRTRDSGYSTSDLYYNLFPSTYGDNDIIDIPLEGTVKYFWLSEEKHLVNSTTESDPTKRILKCSQDECSVTRPFYKSGSNGVKFNYPILKSRYNRTILRTEYPGLYIEKTVNKRDNNNVYLRDELVYTIEITNKSKTGTADGTIYNKFAITESIDKSLVKYVSSSSGTYDDSTGKITFLVNNNLGVNQKVTLTYTVLVKDNYSNINKTIIANGEFHKLNGNNIDNSTYIPTGKVENTIIAPTQKDPTDVTFEGCYNINIDSGQKGLALIDKIYECYYGNQKPLDFTNFNITSLIWKQTTPLTAKSQTNAIKINDNLDNMYTKYKNAILNNYFGGMAKIDSPDDNGKYHYILPNWNSSDTRAKYIDYNHFEDGDVLIYSIDYSDTKNDTYNDSSTISSFPKYKHTAENGIYAYIYINGEFIGLNGTGNSIRNKFTYDYYCTDNHSSNPNPTCDSTCLTSNNIASCTDSSTTSNQLKLLTAHLYSNITSITGSNNANTLSKRKEALKIANYQTLYDKDYYVILRPSKLVNENIELTFSDNYSVINDKNVLKIALNNNSKNGLSYDTLLEEVTTNGSVSIKDHDDYQVIFSNEYLKTGYTFIDYFSRKVSYPNKKIEYKIIIMGDILKEGKPTKNSITKTAQHIIDGNIITDEESLIAADMDNNNQIKINDITKMLNTIN